MKVTEKSGSAASIARQQWRARIETDMEEWAYVGVKGIARQQWRARIETTWATP